MSNLILPLMVLIIIIYGSYKKVKVYDVFIDGAKDSFKLSLNIFPSLLAMVLGINLLIESQVLNLVFGLLETLFKLPVEILLLSVVRPLSASSSLSILNSIYSLYGTDGYLGMLASYIQGSTDTTIYIITLYFGSVGIKKIRYSLWVGLITDLLVVLFSILVAGYLI